MKVLFDQGTPVPPRKYLQSSEVATTAELGWSELENGDLLAEAERKGFDLMITTDQNLRYQQNLSERQIGVVVLMTTSWPRIQSKVEEVVSVVSSLPPGGYVQISF